MTAALPLSALAAIQGDKDLPHQKKALSVEAFDTVAYALWMINGAETSIRVVQEALQARGVSFDVMAFQAAQMALDAAFAALQPAILAHIDALDAQMGGAS